MVLTAADVKARYDSVLADSGARIAAHRARRQHYTSVTAGVPGINTWNWQGSTASAVRNEARHNLRVARAHQTAVRLTGRFMGELPQTRVMPRKESPEERWRAESVERMLSGVYYHSGALREFQSVSWHGTVLGAGVVRLEFDMKQMMPKFWSVRPENVLVKLATGDGREWDYVCYSAERSVASVAAKWGVKVSSLEADRVEAGTGREFAQVVDYWDEEEHAIVAGGVRLFHEANKFGFHPYIVFRNMGPTEYVWGLSDQEFYEGLAEYYNTMISQHADVIRFWSNPPVLAKQCGLSATEIMGIIREGGVIATNKERADMQVIQSGGAPPEYQAQDTRIRDLMDELSFAPPTAGDRLSGSALMEMGAGQEALLALKRASWEISQQLLNQRMLQMIEKLSSGKVKFSGVVESGMRSRSFYMELDEDFELPSAEDVLAQAAMDPTTEWMSDAEILASRSQVDLNYRRLIDGYYTTRIIWNNRTAKQDPQYQLMLLNKFSQGAMSLRTLLEDTGVEDVEQEIQRVKLENEEMPWLRPQVMQAQQQTSKGFAGDGNMNPAGPNDWMATEDATDAATRGLSGGGVQGMPSGGA